MTNVVAAGDDDGMRFAPLSKDGVLALRSHEDAIPFEVDI